MLDAGFKRLLSRIGRELTADQHIVLRRHLERLEDERAADLAIGERTQAIAGARRCPRCGAIGAPKHGRDKLGRQRFLCPKAAGGCGRTFDPLTETPFARMRKVGRWHAFAKVLSNGFVSIDRLAEMNLGVSRLAAWRWHNRFLEVQVQRQSARLGGVIEVDETYFKTSFKGSRGWVRGSRPENRPPRYRGEAAVKRGLSKEQVAVLAALDAGGGVMDAVLPGLSAIETTLSGRIALGSVVCSDGAKTYVRVSMAAGSEHRRITIPKKKSLQQKLQGGKPRRKGRLGLGRVNAQHERMKSFINRQARDASTANLPIYLGWLRALRRPGFNPADLLSDALA